MSVKKTICPTDGKTKRGILTLTRGTQAYHIYLPIDGDPKKVAVLLSKYDIVLGSLGQAVTDILRKRPDATMVDSAASQYGVADYAYQCGGNHATSFLTQYLGWVMTNGRIGAVTNGGSWHEFLGWAAGHADLASLVGRSIRFSYRGEKDLVPSPRAVLVESVTDALINGTDLLKMEPRAYRLDRIQGDIVVAA